MNNQLYFCTTEDNTCPKKYECKRYLKASGISRKTTLFNEACTENNGYVLFIKNAEEGEEQ